MANDNAAPDAAEIAAWETYFRTLSLMEQNFYTGDCNCFACSRIRDNFKQWLKHRTVASMTDAELRAWEIMLREVKQYTGEIPIWVTHDLVDIGERLLAAVQAQAARIGALESENARLRKLWTTKQRWEP